MGVGDLRKKSAATNAADSFISGAKVRDQNSPKPAPSWKRVTFSLSEEVDRTIEKMSYLPLDFRATKSDVIRAAVQLLSEKSDDEIKKRLFVYQEDKR